MAKLKRLRLTKKTISGLEYEGKLGKNAAGKDTATKHIVWDVGDDTFGIRVFPSGRKVWVYQYWVEGRRRLLQLGDWPAMTRDRAKEAVDAHAGAAADARAKVDDAYDPIEKRRQKRQAAIVEAFCKKFMEEHGGGLKTADTYQARIRKHILPAWRNRKLASIKRSDVSALHRAIGKNTPYEANRTLAQIAVMFTKAEEWGDVPEGYPNPARGIQTFKERKRSRWVRPDELPRLAEAIEKEPSIYVRSAIWLYLLTGLRKNELLYARWEHVNFEDKSLFLPTTKADREHTVPLSDSAVTILANIPREANNPYIIPGRKAGSHLVNIRKPWRRILNRAVVNSWAGDTDVDEALIQLREDKISDMRVRLGREPAPAEVRRLPEPTADEIRKLVGHELSTGLLDVTVHDLRRSVGSWLVSFGGANLPLIARVLGHTNLSTTQTYARLAEDPARQAIEDHGKRIMEATEGIRAVK